MITTRVSIMSPIAFKLIIIMLCLAFQVVPGEQEMRCLKREREALLQFKASLLDRHGMLSSWTTATDCCQWKGIRCSNLTANIVSLDLHGDQYDYETYSRSYISGEIHESLIELQQLKYLNLSWNLFPDNHIPEFLASLSNLRFLDLSQCEFGGKIPSQLGSLSHLKYLNLAGNFLEGSIPPQLGNLSKLEYLDLRRNYFEGNLPSQFGNLSNLQKFYLKGSYDGVLKINGGGKLLSNLISLTHLYLCSIRGLNSSHTWLQVIVNLPKLRELSLFDSSLSDHFILSLRPYQFNFSTSLLAFHLSGNTFTSPVIFPWVSNITSNLVELYLVGNNLEGSVSNHFGMAMNSLEHLDLSFNSFKGEVLKSFMNICTLNSLSMYENNLTEDLPSILHNLSNGCIRHSLLDLDLTNNQITCSLPDLSTFSVLKSLDLSRNRLNGKITDDIKLPFSLESLSISSNLLEGGIPKSFGNACALRTLDMSNNNLSDEFSMIMDHLSRCARYSLQELNLGENQINGTLLDLSEFSNLKSLDLSRNRLNGKITEDIKLPFQLDYLSISSNFLEGGIPKSFGNACALHTLDMTNNNLSDEFSMIIHYLSRCARYSLQELNLGENQINGTLPNLSAFSTLKSLDLSRNRLNGKITEDIKLPFQLDYLSISSNFLEGGIPKSFGNACALSTLDMTNNSLTDDFSMIMHHLSGCVRYSLENLYLSMNEINGTLPNLSIFSSLQELFVDGNKLNGEISKSIQFPPQLRVLCMESNSLNGVFTDYHFVNISKLSYLDLSDNSLTLTFTQKWIPPFQLRYIYLRSCMLGPTFPKWLQTQNKFVDLDISNAGISDMVPRLFWEKLALRINLFSVNISNNNLHGIISNFATRDVVHFLTLASNQFEGPIPPFLRGSIFLDLSNNNFSDSLSFLCASGPKESLHQLDLSNNQLSGEIPDCWSHLKSLAYLDLSHNKFSGNIPTSLGSLLGLQALLLRNNNLKHDIPFSLRHCAKLVKLDVSGNKLSGHIPAWIGSEMQDLQILSLGRNHFSGILPLQICYLKSLQILDISLNNLTGKIPACINNFTSMAYKKFSSDYRRYSYFVNTSNFRDNQSYELNVFLDWKGSEQMFKTTELLLLKGIDLSSNKFSEEIPVEIESLVELISLNLSRNNLIGTIPSNIGKLKSLEFLDLSRNQFVGSIPVSLKQIDRLAMLDLSHNHLSGVIPTGTQLQSFDASSYEDNLNLCGPPLEKCIDDEPTEEAIVKIAEYSLLGHDFYIGMVLGFVISFWMVFGTILFKKSWRHAYFKFLNNLSDDIYVMIVVKFKWCK
ncbi:hypothetical protein VNO80_13334 [Phaseolus coccineus]|uniref:Leucine-rich repeat-containing N-terminal plant-type domain-containing protein n=1 Tax=Phaseolus coccineus TaxID=3886 RepID=A0AAN9N621_PHACN